MCTEQIFAMKHAKTIFKKKAGGQNGSCSFKFFPQPDQLIRGVYDLESDRFYAADKQNKPIHSKPFLNLKHFAVAHHFKKSTYAERVYIRGKSLAKLQKKGMDFS